MKIEVKNLSKNFKKIQVLNEINCNFESGKIYGIIGRNGSGKSVLLKIICGFYEPTSGEVLFDGVNIIKQKTFPPNLRALIEKPSFLPDLTGFENLKLLACIQNKIGNNEILEALKNVNLYEEKNKKYKEYSLGMKQKLGIAQVIMEDPDIMILDEPFNGIENDTAKELRKLFKTYANNGKLIIIATHIKDDIYTMTDVLYEMDAGILKK